MQTITLEISPSALPGWRLLPHGVRWHVGAFPGISASAKPEGSLGFTQSLSQPASPAVRIDVAETATRLAMAFPRMVRRVMAVAMDGRITVRLECEGLHEGMWGDIIYPTWRRVSFQEQHEIVATGGRLVSDRITLDIPGILKQLCGSDRIDPDEKQLCVSDRIDPDETVPVGRARRDAYERARMAAERSRRDNPRS